LTLGEVWGGGAVTLAAWSKYSLTGKCAVAQSVREELNLLERRCSEALYFYYHFLKYQTVFCRPAILCSVDLLYCVL
jgi:hypothetical protein